MPLYDFECRACQNRFEAQGRYGEPNPACPSCQSAEVDKLPGLGTLRTKVPAGGLSWENPRYRGVNSSIKKNPNFNKS
jgi:putative FmdB family regulatory protein